MTSTIRTEFGFQRLSCACTQCCEPCKFIPGYLIPGDVERLYKNYARTRLNYLTRWTLSEWATRHLLASPGALASKDGSFFRIKTIVPANKHQDHSCHWLTDSGQCSVHEDAPFGCSFTNVCESDPALGAAVSRAGLTAIMEDRMSDGPYSRLWQELWDLGLRSETPEVKRKRMLSADELPRT